MTDSSTFKGRMRSNCASREDISFVNLEVGSIDTHVFIEMEPFDSEDRQLRCVLQPVDANCVAEAIKKATATASASSSESSNLLSSPRADFPRSTVEVRLDQPLTKAIDELERKFIEHALSASNGRVADAAQLLGLSRKGLFLKRRRRGLVGSGDSSA